MSNFTVEETITDSVTGDILFTLVTWQGRNFLYQGNFTEISWQQNRIAECVNGDYVNRYKNINGWLSSVNNREKKKNLSLRDRIINLQLELETCDKLINDIDYARN